MRKNFIFTAIGVILLLLFIIGIELHSLRESAKINVKAMDITCSLRDDFTYCNEKRDVSKQGYDLINSLPEVSDSEFDLDVYVVKMSDPNHPIYIYDNNTGYFLYSVDLNKDGSIHVEPANDLAKIGD